MKISINTYSLPFAQVREMLCHGKLVVAERYAFQRIYLNDQALKYHSCYRLFRLVFRLMCNEKKKDAIRVNGTLASIKYSSNNQLYKVTELGASQ